MITERQAEKAVHYLHENARAHAQARAERVYMEEYRKVMKAQIMNEVMNEPEHKRESRAYADPRYIAHLDAMRTAIQKDEEGRFLREAASATFEAYRTQEATRRAGP